MKLILMALALLAGQAVQALQGSTVEGVVVHEGTNEPIRAAEVRLGLGLTGATMLTDDAGKFQFQSVPAGSYSLAVNHSDYMPGTFGQRGPNGPGKKISISGGQSAKDIVIRLAPRSAVFGRVFSRTGEAAANVPVQLLRYLYIDGRRMLSIDKETRTNEAGEYRFAKIAPLEYSVSAEARYPQTPSYLRGTTVYFPGTVDPDSVTSINAQPGVEYGGIDITLIERDALSIRGHVVDAVTGNPPASFFLVLAPRDRRTWIAGDTAPRRIAVALDGSFTIEAVPPGFYDLIAMSGDGNERRAARVPINARGNVDDLQLTLRPGFGIRGTVNVDGLIPQTDLSGVTISLTHEPYITQVSPRSVQASADGTFSLGGIIPGDYRIRVTTKFDAYVVYARLGGADILNSVVHIDSENGNLLDVRLKPNNSTLEVTVFDEMSAPAESVQVALVPESLNRARLEVYETAQTDSSGKARLQKLEPGEYKAFAWESLESGKWQDPDFLQLNEHLGTTVRIGENTSERLSLRLLRTPK